MGDTRQGELLKWLMSVKEEIKEDADLNFFKPPGEHRVVVTSKDVIDSEGKYYIRVFGGESHACESDGAGLFCAVTAKSVTPNYNTFNIKYECKVYTQDDCKGTGGMGSSIQ